MTLNRRRIGERAIRGAVDTLIHGYFRRVSRREKSKDFCLENRVVYKYLTENIATLNPKISGYLKDLEERGELPKAESSTELQATQGLAGAGLAGLARSSTPLSTE